MGARLTVAPGVTIGGEELEMSFVRSGGPGGQNVNKVASKCVLSFDVLGSPSFNEAQLARLREQLAARLTKDGRLVLHASEFRTQERNAQAATDRLLAILRAALEKPKTRRATRPTAGSKRRRLAAKKRNAEKKQGRRSPGPE